MSTGFPCCSGILQDETVCPLASKCKRFHKPSPLYTACIWVRPAYDGKRCPEFVGQND